MLAIISIYSAAIVSLMIIGSYALFVTRNAIRLLIGLEIMTKAATLALIFAGKLSDKMALAQSLVVTLILIEVVVVVVIAGIILNVYLRKGTIDMKQMNKLRG